MKRRFRRPFWAGLFLFVFPLVLPAAQLVVTSVADDGSEGTLRAVIARAVDGDTVTFAPVLAGQTIALTTRSQSDNGICFASSVSIIGPAGGIVLNGGWDGSDYNLGTRILCMTNAVGSLRVENLVFEHANGRDWSVGSQRNEGGAVLCAGAFAATNCVFRNNVGRGASISPDGLRGGGAITVTGPLSLSRCSFLTNSLNTTGSYGGAVLANGSEVHVADCLFDGNFTGTYCGTMYFGASVTNAVLEGCRFLSGHSGGSGSHGGMLLAAMTGLAPLRLRNCVFRNGHPALDRACGGVLYADSVVRLIAENCEFSNGYGTSTGGAVRMNNGSASAVFVNCTVSDCRAASHGGGLDMRCPCVLVNCTMAGNIMDNTSDKSASGGVYKGGTLALLNSAVVYNYYGLTAAGDIQSAPDTMVDSYANSNYARTTTTNGVGDGTCLFAGYRNVGTITNVVVTTLVSPVIVPVLNSDAKRVRVVEIAKNGALDRTGYPVKVNANYTYIAYSTDNGTTWTKLQSSMPDDDGTAVRILSDARGVAYRDGKPPIGAAAVEPSPGFYIIVCQNDKPAAFRGVDDRR